MCILKTYKRACLMTDAVLILHVLHLVFVATFAYPFPQHNKLLFCHSMAYAGSS